MKKQPHTSLDKILEHASHLLPAQMPIERFVHHNTLHSFESLPFDEAVLAAKDLYDAQPYMDEPFYRKAYREGRITRDDLIDIIKRLELPDVTPVVSSQDILLNWMLHLPETDLSTGLDWLIHERKLLCDYPQDLGRHAAERLLEAGPSTRVLPTLWRAAGQHTETLAHIFQEKKTSPRIHLVLREHTGVDLDDTIHPELISACASYLDQGISHWSAPDREVGFFDYMLKHYSQTVIEPIHWRRTLRKLLRSYKNENLSAEDVIERCIDALGLEASREDFILQTLLALRGWAGMFSMIERRPDTAPMPSPPNARLIDFLAIRLAMEHAVLTSTLDLDLKHTQTFSHIFNNFNNFDNFKNSEGFKKTREIRAFEESKKERTEQQVSITQWILFHALLYNGIDAELFDHFTTSQRTAFFDMLATYHEIKRRELWQLAYERNYRVKLLDGLLLHQKHKTSHRSPKSAEVQIVMCIDDREESIRRHIEEIEPRYETLGAGGFFGVAMNFRALHSPHTAPLCPPSVSPKHYIYEKLHGVSEAEPTALSNLYGQVHTRQGTTFSSGVLTSIMGVHKILPMMTRILAPRTHAKMFATPDKEVFSHTKTKLVILRETDELTPEGWHQGYTYEEMSEVIRLLLEDMGLVSNFAPLVAMVGHGSTSVNNPHGAGYGCGACGGGHGGPNGRAFAWMANQKEVRKLLKEKGITIPETTYFVGGYHNTTNNDVSFYDLDELPESQHERFAHLNEVLLKARQLDAHERCRRFNSAPLDITPEEALNHVEERSEDLAQPRPEYGHTANALCVVGEREWSRGLFLDRRAFLVSYSPDVDDAQGSILKRLLGSMGPVGAGINLEYYFSLVDNTRYGSGSKLPHNVSGMVGVMNGHRSDLRTGLPFQMVELHEPIRLIVLIEGTPEQVTRIVDSHPGLSTLVYNRWILAAVYDPKENRAWFLEPHGFEEHIVDEQTTHHRVFTKSADIYTGRRDLIQPATLSSLKHTPQKGGAHHVA